MAMTISAGNSVSAPVDVTLNSVAYKRFEVSTGKSGGIHLYFDYEKGTEDGLDMRVIPSVPFGEPTSEPTNVLLLSTASSPISLDTRQYFTLRADTAWPTRADVFAKSSQLWLDLNPRIDKVYVFFKVAGSATWDTGTGKLTLHASPHSR